MIPKVDSQPRSAPFSVHIPRPQLVFSFSVERPRGPAGFTVSRPENNPVHTPLEKLEIYNGWRGPG
ncbi:uncharacterized protein BKA55DRAFT_581552 [Fusarium redolens]|jgi:hypothetical protein|uniref:Uncharacterized protein n=1 Tax=Fusarium redolens TaxID=48865 RepID=A0A9P9G387_FUSRE|nr:uncharacterized protein BKA55DRAFT_581552 [Fusarium redolens]KAH7231721.1 hypothetical protein BKA55DRAFT_581552 [Fusarium redolens]